MATLRGTISQIAGDLGLWVGASGTHPFSHWESQLITDHVRYNQIVNELQEAARSNLIFGLHVHVGMGGSQDGYSSCQLCKIFSAPRLCVKLPLCYTGSGEDRVINPSVQKVFV